MSAAIGVAATTRQFDRCFVRFGTAVAKENSLAERVLDEHEGERGLGQAVVQVRNMDQRGRLVLDGLGDGRMTVPEIGAQDTGEKIQNSLPVCRDELRALT